MDTIPAHITIIQHWNTSTLLQHINCNTQLRHNKLNTCNLHCNTCNSATLNIQTHATHATVQHMQQCNTCNTATYATHACNTCNTQHSNTCNTSAAGSNLRMVRPSLMSVVKLLIIRPRSVAKICSLVFLAARRHSHCTSASNWDSKAWKFSHTERKSYACALRYVPCLSLLQNSRPHKCKTCNYVSTSAENGLAMAGPAGPVPAPMNTATCSCNTATQ